MEPASDRPQRRYRRRTLTVSAAGIVLAVVIAVLVASSGGGSDGGAAATRADSDDPTEDESSATSALPSSSTVVTVPPSDAPSPTEARAPSTPTIADVIVESPSFSTLEQLFDDAALWGLIDASASSESMTLLAPTDEAFDRAFERLGADGYAHVIGVEAQRALLTHIFTPQRTIGELEPGPVLTWSDTEIDVTDDARPAVRLGPTIARFGARTDTDIETANGVIHAIDEVLIPPDIVASVTPASPDVTATYADGLVVLRGSVVSAEQKRLLGDAARTSVDPANVRNEIVVDDRTTATPDGVERLSSLVLAMAPNLAVGTATLTGDAIELDGIELDAARGARLTDLGVDLGVDVAVEARPRADAADVERLQAELDALVADEPMLFVARGTELDASADPGLERIAGGIRAIDGIVVVVVGHTDSDGSAANNVVLSDARARVVRDALVDAGVDPDVVIAEGRGDAEPIVDPSTGVEDKAASRRITFVVALSDQRSTVEGSGT